MKKVKTPHAGTAEVDQFLAALDHPLKAEVQAVRQIIKGVHPEITEQVKWNAPTFSYHGQYLVTFHLRPTDHLHLVFHHPQIVQVHSPLLEGDYKDRRMAYLRDAKEIRAKKRLLEKALQDLLALIPV